MDQVVKSVEETWNPVSHDATARCEKLADGLCLSFRVTLHDRSGCRESTRLMAGYTANKEYLLHRRFRGSDDDLRSKFEEYICSALSTMKYADYVASGQTSIPIPGGEFLPIATPITPRAKAKLTVLQTCRQTFLHRSPRSGWLPSKRQAPAKPGTNRQMNCCSIYASQGICVM